MTKVLQATIPTLVPSTCGMFYMVPLSFYLTLKYFTIFSWDHHSLEVPSEIRRYQLMCTYGRSGSTSSTIVTTSSLQHRHKHDWLTCPLIV